MIEEVHQKQKKKEARQVIDLAKEMAIFSSKKRILNQREESNLQKIEEQKEEIPAMESILKSSMRSKKKESQSPPNKCLKATDSTARNDQELNAIRLKSTIALSKAKADNEPHVSFKRQLSKKKLFETISPSDDQSDRKEPIQRTRSIDTREIEIKSSKNTLTNTIPSTIVSTISDETCSYPKPILFHSRKQKSSTVVNKSVDNHYHFSDDLYNDNFKLEHSSKKGEDENEDEFEDDFNEFYSTFDQNTDEGAETKRKKTLYEREMYSLKLKQERIERQREHIAQTIDNEMQQRPQMALTSRMITDTSRYIPLYIRANQLHSIKHTRMVLNENKKKMEKAQEEEEELRRMKEFQVKKGGNTKVDWDSFVKEQMKWKNEVIYKAKAKTIIEENKIAKSCFRPVINENTRRIAEQKVKDGARPRKDIHVKLYNDHEERNDRREALVLKNKPSFKPKVCCKGSSIKQNYAQSKTERKGGNEEAMYWEFLYEQYDRLNNKAKDASNETFGMTLSNPPLTQRGHKECLKLISKGKLKEEEEESFSLTQYKLATEQLEQITNKAKQKGKEVITSHFNSTPLSKTSKCIDEYCQTEPFEIPSIPTLIGLPEMFNKTTRIAHKEFLEEEEASAECEDNINSAKSKSEISNTFRNELREFQETAMQTDVHDPSYKINICKAASLSNNPDVILPTSKQYQFLIANNR